MAYSPLRQLAIRLACLHAEDRNWVLARLDIEERKRMDDLLQEINLLGLAADPAVVAAVMAEPLVEVATATVQGSTVEHVLAKARHPLWAGLVLQIEEQSSRKSMLAALPNAAAVRHWDHELNKQPIPPALVQCLVQYLDEQGDTGEHA